MNIYSLDLVGVVIIEIPKKKDYLHAHLAAIKYQTMKRYGYLLIQYVTYFFISNQPSL